MIFTSWLDSVRSRLSGKRRRRSLGARASLEKLEDRTLLSVSALFSNGTLAIASVDDNGPDTIEVGADGMGNVHVRANGVTSGPVHDRKSGRY